MAKKSTTPPEPKYLAKTFHRGQYLLPTQLAPAKPTRDGAAEMDDEGGKLAAGELAILARTREPVTIWGETFVHDFESLNIPTLTPVDYCHDPDQILGHADGWGLTDEGLNCLAHVFSMMRGDRADEILTRLGHGTPYQASIQFEGTLAYYYQGEVEVNGVKYSAPLWVWSNWTVLAIAVCPLGRDGMTRTELLAQELREQALQLTRGSSPPSDPPKGLTISQEEIKRYHTRFGAKAAEYLAQGLSYDKAVDAHALDLEKQLAASQVELDQAKQAAAAKGKTGLFSRGQSEPISGGTPTGEAAAPKGLSPLEAAYANPRFRPKGANN